MFTPLRIGQLMSCDVAQKAAPSKLAWAVALGEYNLHDLAADIGPRLRTPSMKWCVESWVYMIEEDMQICVP